MSIKVLILISFLMLSLPLLAKERKNVNIDSLSEKQRNEYLIKYTRKVVKRFGPGYYRDTKPPVIKRVVVGEVGDKNSGGRMRRYHDGRAYYMVRYLYDTTYEYFHYGYAAEVCFWADTGVAFKVMFGGGLGICEIDKPETWEDKTNFMPYKRRPPKKPRIERSTRRIEEL